MIFILGGDGFVGSAFCRMFDRLDHPYRVVNRANYDALAGTPCDVFINANGNSRKYLADREPLQEFDASVRSVVRSLLDFPARRYVHLSTGDVYPDPSSAATTAESAVIDVARLSRYGLHKYLAEQVVRGSHSDWLIVRMGGMVGPGLKKNAIFDILYDRPVWLAPGSALQFLSTDHTAEIVWRLVGDGVNRQVVNVSAAGLQSIGALHATLGSRSAFQPDAPTIRYELSLDRLQALAAAPLPRTVNEVETFVAQYRR